MKETFRDFFCFSESEQEHFELEFFLSPNNLSEAELSKVAKGLRTIVRRLGKAQQISGLISLAPKKKCFFWFTSLVPQKKGKKE